MRKFIVTAEGRLRYGDVALHRHLLRPGESCIGGGFYDFDAATGRMLLTGRSYDYGRVKWGWVDTLIVPRELEGLTLEYEGLPLGSFANIRYEGHTT